MFAIELPTSIEDRLDALVKATGRPKDEYVREAILEHLDDMEDLYLAESRLAQNSPATPLEEVMKRYGMEG
jgi:RHH-type rel operon transcriptional repressor/antitoxin RelB